MEKVNRRMYFPRVIKIFQVVANRITTIPILVFANIYSFNNILFPISLQPKNFIKKTDRKHYSIKKGRFRWSFKL